MHRFYLLPAYCTGECLRLEDREAHHAINVLRLKPGELVMVLDGQGHTLVCEVDATAKHVITLIVRSRQFSAPLPCQITLIQALPKGKIIDSIIQKAVELGVGRIVPILSERVLSQVDGEEAEAKREKWQQVAVEAIKQCGAAWLPRVAAPMTVDKYLALQEPLELTLVGSLQADRRHPRTCLHEFVSAYGRPPRSVGIWIGPEGDFTPSELSGIQAAGAQPISLGQLVLRVETAAIYGLSVLNYEFNALA